MRGRPRKPRIVRNEPNTKQFSPRGSVGRPGYSELKYEELEAIRLADFAGLNQTDAAKSMKISQQTFSRVLRKAREKVAEAIVLGRIIRVKGGDFRLEK
jgi:predicted DNA-binding protein (UPF0251 family)